MLSDTKYAVSSKEIRRLFEAVYASPLGDMRLHRDFASRNLDPTTKIRRVLLLMKDLGILTATMEYGTPSNGMNPGRHFHYQVNIPRHQALPMVEAAIKELEERKLAARSEGQKVSVKHRLANAAARRQTEAASVSTAPTNGNGYEPPTREDWKPVRPEDGVALAKTDKEEVRAVSGPEAPSPFVALAPLRRDEAQALLSAAAQYLNRSEVLSKQFDSLKTAAAALGITIDIETVMKSVSFDRDERLEHIALVVPFVRGLEAAVERLSAQVQDQRARVSEFDKVRRERDRLADRLRDMTSARVLQGQRDAELAGSR